MNESHRFLFISITLLLTFQFSPCLSLLSSRVIPSNPICGPGIATASIFTNQFTDPRVQFQQVLNTFLQIYESNETHFSADEMWTNNIPAPTNLFTLPSDLYSTDSCCCQAYQVQTTLLFYSFCVNDTHMIETQWSITFNNINTTLCADCLTANCSLSLTNCHECSLQCGNNKMLTVGQINTTSFSPQEQRDLHFSEYSFPRNSNSFSRTDLQTINSDLQKIPEQIHSECVAMGDSGTRILQLGIYEGYLGLYFTPSSDQLSSPESEQETVCFVGMIGDKMAAVPIMPPVSSTDAFFSMAIPWMSLDSESFVGFLVFCEYQTDPQHPRSLKWTITVSIIVGDLEYFWVTPFTHCPKQMTGHLRQLNSTSWEMMFANSEFEDLMLQIMSCILVCNQNLTSCEVYAVQIVNPCNQDVSGDWAGTLIELGTSLYLGYLESSQSFLLISNFLMTTGESSLLIHIPDWTLTYSLEDILSIEPSSDQIIYLPNPLTAEIITTIPNNVINLDFSIGGVSQITAEVIEEGLFITYINDYVTNYTTIFECPPGFFFMTDPRGCLPCPPGQYKNTTRMGRNCDLCPSGTFSPFYNSTTSDNCHSCPEGTYCPPGSDHPMRQTDVKVRTISCTDPWFQASQSVDLEGSFYINQGLAIFLLCVLALVLSLIAKTLTSRAVEFLAGLGEWMWEVEEEEPEIKKILWGIAALGALMATIMLIGFTFYLLVNANTFIQTQVEVGNAVSNTYPDGYQQLSMSPIWINITMKGRFSYPVLAFLTLSSSGFYSPTSGEEIHITDFSSSATERESSYAAISIPQSFSDSPSLYVNYYSLFPDQFIYEITIEFSTGYNYETNRLQTCSTEQTVSQTQNLKVICKNPGFSFASVTLMPETGQTLRGSTSVKVSKTIGVVEDCNPSYNSNPFSFAITQQSCSFCNSSTVLLFPSIASSVLQYSDYYYEQNPDLQITISLESEKFARTASISQYLSVGSALLLLLVTSMGLQELFELSLSFGWWLYTFWEFSKTRISHKEKITDAPKPLHSFSKSPQELFQTDSSEEKYPFL